MRRPSLAALATINLLVIAVIAGWHAINSWLSYRSPRFDHLTGGGPVVLVRGGAIDRQAMAHERVSASIAALPLTIVYILMSRQFIRGMTAGAVK